MRKTSIILLSFVLFAGVSCQWLGSQGQGSGKSQQLDAAAYADPFFGTAGAGNTLPGALRPWGMIRVNPCNVDPQKQTRSHYQNGNPKFYGLSLSGYSQSSCPATGDIVVVPSSGNKQVAPEKYASAYSNETAEPGYYSIFSDKYQIQTRASAAQRSAILKFSFPKGENNILFDLGQRGETFSSLAISGKNEISGFVTQKLTCADASYRVYFVAEFDRAAAESGFWKKKKIAPKEIENISGKNIGAFFRFSCPEKQDVQMRIGISYVNTKNARKNLEEELKRKSFERLRKEAYNDWNDKLSRIEVQGGSAQDRVLFYSALYKALQFPKLLSDVTGHFPAVGRNRIEKAEGYERYTIFPLWYSHRTLHPLLILAYPEVSSDMMQSLVNMYQETAWLPLYEIMGIETHFTTGDPALSVIADAYLKNIRDFEYQIAYKGMTDNARKVLSNIMRKGMEYYDKNQGYVPFGKRGIEGEVSASMAYNYADWCLVQMAKQLNHTGDAEKYARRTAGYQFFFHQESDFFRPRYATKAFTKFFNPEKNEKAAGFYSGNAWQNFFSAPHDIQGIKKLLGGDRAFAQKLEQFFEKEQFDPAVETCLSYPFLFNYVSGESRQTQKTARQCLRTHFSAAPNGLPANDRNGMLSAWVVWTMMGIYPDCPCSKKYQIASPVFDEITIHLDKNYYQSRKFEIKTRYNSPKNVFIKKKKLFGKQYDETFISHNDISRGATLRLEMEGNTGK